MDLRNQYWNRCIIRNEYSAIPAQKELTESSEELYYPILDRIHESLHEKYIEGLYKKKIGSPYSVTIGNNLDQYGEMLASSLIVSMYNGSLTHILLIYEKIRDFVFYLSCKYDDWNLRLNLYKLAIFAGNEKEIKGIQGKDGVYFGRGTREIATVRAILLGEGLVYDADTMDALISVVANTLLISKEGISTKLDAIALLICIVVKYPEHYIRNQSVFEKLFEQQSTIEVAENSIISSNIDSISLKIGLQFLFASIGKNVYGDILELMPYIQGNVATTIAVTHLYSVTAFK